MVMCLVIKLSRLPTPGGRVWRARVASSICSSLAEQICLANGNDSRN